LKKTSPKYRAKLYTPARLIQFPACSLLRPQLLFGEETLLKRRFKFFLKNKAFQEEQALKSPARIFGFESSFHSSLFPSSPTPRGKTKTKLYQHQLKKAGLLFASNQISPYN